MAGKTEEASENRLIPKENFKSIPQYELLNNETEFIAIFVI